MFEHEAQLQPRWWCAEGFVRNGPADSHIAVDQLAAEKVCVCGAADLLDAFCFISYLEVWRAVTGRGPLQHWLESVSWEVKRQSFEGRKQRPPDSLVLINLIIDEALGPW